MGAQGAIPLDSQEMLQDFISASAAKFEYFLKPEDLRAIPSVRVSTSGSGKLFNRKHALALAVHKFGLDGLEKKRSKRSAAQHFRRSAQRARVDQKIDVDLHQPQASDKLVQDSGAAGKMSCRGHPGPTVPGPPHESVESVAAWKAYGERLVSLSESCHLLTLPWSISNEVDYPRLT